ncbi:glycosyltransferase [Paracoccus methylarcula]|uniref:Glycosyl transferase n=1 Tax=Paracoccus methylarcula TaxID=72022 RepID=A0A3R7LJI3_9RHOB|nr:glycosyltransferase [Paracoccus methylarcula]RNF36133.1 glycosyl transferase [Paracoccus methylarcula]
MTSFRHTTPIAVTSPPKAMPPAGPSHPPAPTASLGQCLIDDGAVDPAHLLKAAVMRHRQYVPLERILLINGWVTAEALLRAQSRQWRVDVIDPQESPPDPRLIDLIGAEHCLARNILPWRRMGGVTWIATCDPERFMESIAELPSELGRIRMLLCREDQIEAAILSLRRGELIRKAEARVPARESCRTRNHRLFGWALVVVMAVLALGFWQAPRSALTALTIICTLGLLAQTGLKLICFITALRSAREERRRGRFPAAHDTGDRQQPPPLPTISVLVPLFQEGDVARALVARLSRIRYPRELMDILMVVETGDKITRDALSTACLPRWIRVIEVPDGPIRTKPRALNYALNFCKGSIVGIWDAEDQPDPDQLHRIARHFRDAPRKLGCVQGVLDYYNPRSNWLARCFTIEYAAWFRVMLPAIARLGLVLPLGGTTCFFRREALEDVDAWDAWNVTEDADLGVRLARRGWRTEMIDTTTEEEANCRPLPWIRQRSRWLKGFAMTWGVHMRSPWRLWRDLGTWRFIGFQVQFLVMLTQYLLAPAIWGFWLLCLGLSYPLQEPLQAMFGASAIPLLLGFLLGSEMLNIAVGMFAVRKHTHRHLRPWVLTMQVYFPLGCIAAWKAFHELLRRPFYWDKTAHGIFPATTPDIAAEGPPETVALPVLGHIGTDAAEKPTTTDRDRTGTAA